MELQPGIESGQERAPGRKPESELEMQGQPLYHENQNSAQGSVSTTATMDEQPQQQATPSAAPQIRSRITVVCAECKRLKLKCDRRTPCGSCTKRDTVSRCIYSPAAAEKVDLHSLNNRLIQVEAILAMVTAGKTPPPFQSSYPLAQVTLPTSHSMKSRASHATAASPASSISIRLNDLMNIWLTHCQLDLFAPGNLASLKSEMPSDSTYVKLEPSHTDALQLATPYDNTIIIDEEPSIRTPAAPMFQPNLPPLHIYYSSSTVTPQQQEGTSTQYTYPPHNPYPANFNSPFPPQREYEFPPPPQKTFNFPDTSYSASGSPAITPAVFALLPPPPMRTKLLSSARAAHPHLPLLMHWARIVVLADPEAASAKERQKALACAVFFGAHVGSPTPTPSTPSSNTGTTSLPLFACLCYLLALGALEPNSDAAVDHSFLYALAGQVMGVWEEYRTSVEVKEEEEKEEGDAGGEVRKPQHADIEKEEMDHLVASLLQVKYLLRTGSSASSKNHSSMLETVFPLIGKLVNLARGLGLARDPEEDPGTGPKMSSKAEERRRMLWWDIMFHDTFTSDTLDHAPLVTSYSYTTKIPAIAQTPQPPSSDAPSRQNPSPMVNTLTDDDENEFSIESFEPEEIVPKPNSPPKANGATKGRSASRLMPQFRGKRKGKGSPAQPADDAESGFFGVRCRLTRLAQTVKHRLAHPGCECCTCGNGYTLDQAARLEAEVRAWSADLPASLKLETSTTSADSKSDVSNSPRHAALAAELAILANRMIITAYVPLMRPAPEAAASSSASASAYSASHPWSPASRATLDAAQGVVRAARVLHCLSQAGGGTALMGEYYPLEKAVVDALVICAHSGFATGKAGRAVMEEVTVALEMLESMGRCEGELGRIVASLKRRVEAGDTGRRGDENTLKRKHYVLEGGMQGEQAREMNARAEGMAMAMAVDLERTYGKIDEGSNENILPTPPQQHQQHRPVIPQPPTPQRAGSVAPRSRTSDKKSPKKGYPAYPSVGVRDRGKEGAPWMAKKSSLKFDVIPDPKLPEPTLAPTGDGNMTFESPNPPQQLSPVQHRTSRPMLDTGYRSRSSSISQAPRMQPVEYSTQFGEPEDRHPDMHANQRRRFSIQEHGQQQQPQQQSEQPQVQPFAMSPTNMYNPSQQPSRAGSFDAPRGFEQHRGSFDQNTGTTDPTYGGESSPYPNTSAPLSAASSPYGSSSGHPQTPTFGTGSHRHTPPTFGAQAIVASPQAYFHISEDYETPYDAHGTQHQQQVLGGMSMDTSMSGQALGNTGDAMGIPSGVPSTPIYEEVQPLLYDVKPPVDLAQHQHQHQAIQHYQVVSGRNTPIDTQHQMSMNPSAHHTWAPTPQYMQPQPSADQPDPQYWNTGAYYR